MIIEEINNYKNASDIHKKIRKELNHVIKEDTQLIDISTFIEHKIKKYSDKNQINNGIAFPVGLSLNNIAAHWTPSQTCITTLNYNDVLKIDYGVHKNGCIIDSAFTWCPNPIYNNLLDASKETVYSLIKHIGVDSMISEIGILAEEMVKSYEIEIDGILKPIVPIDKLCGHSIKPWNIHAGKYIQNIKNNDTTKIEENDILAIEVFTSTGTGNTYMGKSNSHLMLNNNIPKNYNYKLTQRSQEILDIIKTRFKTLAFTQKYLDLYSPIKYYEPCLDELYNKGILKKYPPVIEYDKNSKIAQFEHTILVSENININFSIDDDY